MNKIITFTEFNTVEEMSEMTEINESNINRLELQGRINSLSKRNHIILRDDYNFPTIPVIDHMENDELARLDNILSVYFFATLDDVLAEIDTLDDDEIDELGYVLYTEFIDGGQPQVDSGDSDHVYSHEDVVDMVKILCKEYHFIGYLMTMIVDGVIEETETITEAPSRMMKNRDMNKKKRKFMSKTKSQMRRDLSTRKRAARTNKSKNKRYYKANKVKISAYQKSRNSAIKKGKHKVKIRKRT